MEHTKGELKLRPDFPGLAYVENETPFNETLFAIFPSLCQTAKDILKQKANAERLVLCWNCHDDLLEACELASGMLGHDHWDDTQQHGAGCHLCIKQREIIKQIKAAIAKAEPQKGISSSGGS